jgi:4-diphosphocytidyl-2-C-methyl-D-erythritol kinase
MIEAAPAKINLALHVRHRRPDGYHALETIFAFAEDGDVLRATPADRLSLTIGGPFAAGLESDDGNLVMRAARALGQSCGFEPAVAFHLEKNLPVASGIGGGSADAAAALRLLARMHGIVTDDRRLADVAAALGADVPACLCSETVRGEERGDELQPIPAASLTGLPLLLVNPRLPLATGPVFKAWDGIDRGPLAAGDPLAAAQAGRNDLQPPAIRLLPEIAVVLDALAHDGVILARMSGSGATCFALFESLGARDRSDTAIARSRPGWWRLATRLR